MQQSKGGPSIGQLTYYCEGNNNPKSENFTQKLRFTNIQSLVLGKGYDLYQSNERDVITDFDSASIKLPKRKLDIVLGAVGLQGLKAKNYYQKYQNEQLISKEEEIRLFERMFKSIERKLMEVIEKSYKRYGFIYFDQIPNYQREILADLVFNGDLNNRTQDFVLSALKRSQEKKKPKLFDVVTLDQNYWLRQGVTEERIKLRCIFTNEHKTFARMSEYENLGMSDEAFQEIWLQNTKLFSFEGFYIDYKFDSFSALLKKEDSQQPQFKKQQQQQMEDEIKINLNDLILSLKMFYDPLVKKKIFGFALQPFDLITSDVQRLKSEWYPDIYHNQNILKDNEYGDVLMEASKILAQICSGYELAINEDGVYERTLIPFSYPKDLKVIGIMPLHELFEKQEKKNKKKKEYNDSTQSVKSHTISLPNASLKSQQQQPRNKSTMFQKPSDPPLPLTSPNKDNIKSNYQNFRHSTTASGQNLRFSNPNIRKSRDSANLNNSKIIDHSFQNGRDTRSIIRFWIVIKEIKDSYFEDTEYNNFGDYYIIKDIKMKIEARKLVITSKGSLEEVKIDSSSSHPARFLAKKLSENYHILAKHYNCFNRIKQIAKSVAFVSWLKHKRIPMSLELINEYYSQIKQNIPYNKQIMFQKHHHHHPKRPSIDISRSNYNTTATNFNKKRNLSVSTLKKQTESVVLFDDNISPILQFQKPSTKPRNEINASPAHKLRRRMTNSDHEALSVITGATGGAGIKYESQQKTTTPEKIFGNTLSPIKFTSYTQIPSLNDEILLKDAQQQYQELNNNNINNKMITFKNTNVTSPQQGSIKHSNQFSNLQASTSKQHHHYIFSGILLNHIKRNIDDNILRNGIKAFEEDDVFQKVYSGSNENEVHKQDEDQDKNEQQEDVETIKKNIQLHSQMFKLPFYFQKATCDKCGNYLKYSEILCPYQKHYFCRLHHPNSCGYCYRIITAQTNSFNVEGVRYHYECIKCKQCSKTITGRLIRTVDGFIHLDCVEGYIRKLCRANKLDELFENIRREQTLSEYIKQRSVKFDKDEFLDDSLDQS